jgi:hypothetical protein
VPELPAGFWDEERQKLLELLMPGLNELAVAGAQAGAAKLAQVGLVFDDALANARAAEWAREYAGALADLVGATSRELVGQTLATWIETPGATIGGLAEQLAPLVAGNAERALMIAVTETTAAYANGEALAFQEAGIGQAAFLPPGHPRCRCWTTARRVRVGEEATWVILWQTNRDEIVCQTPITTPWGTVEGCRALHNVVISEGPYLGRKAGELG